jgi:glycosyltransferase involved in cell wall biosynthesis
MRLVIDMQGTQTESRHRGIGRYSLSLSREMVRLRGQHEVILALNGLFPETIESVRAAFDSLLPQENIRVWEAAGPVHAADVSNASRRRSAEIIREAFFAGIQPDIVLITSLFEGLGDNAVSSIGSFSNQLPTAVILYDLIPLIYAGVYLPDPATQCWYHGKIDHMRRAHLLLSISASSKKEALDYLGFPVEKVVDISTACDSHFQPEALNEVDWIRLRKQYGFVRPFVLYTGNMDHRKNIEGLIRAYARIPISVRASYQLAVICPAPEPARQRLMQVAARQGLGNDELVLTGSVSEDDLLRLYNACTLFVFPSWHEGFGLPILEAMACGRAVIGSNTSSIPEVIGREDALFDPFDDQAISSKMFEVLTNDDLRSELARSGLQRARDFSWERTARRAWQALETLAAQQQSLPAMSVRKRHTFGQRVRELVYLRHHPRRYADPYARAIEHCYPNEVFGLPAVVDAVAQVEPPLQPQDWPSIATALANNFPPSPRRRQLFIDISILVQNDAKTGIQRVVRALLRELLLNPPDGWSVEPVYAIDDARCYSYARRFTSRFLDIPADCAEDRPVDAWQGDVFLGLDLHLAEVPLLKDYLFGWHRRGIKVFFVVYDLLPIALPQCFPDDSQRMHQSWLRTISHFDGVACISRTVADELNAWLRDFGPKRERPLKLGWFHLGADVENTMPTTGMPDSAEKTLTAIRERPSFLMVGTIEPRKGYAQTLSAFELLWAEGVDVNLLIVGCEGWKVESLTTKLLVHRECGKHLFWLDAISDQYLGQVYAAISCLIAASEGEGFGLPLVEAAQHGLPIIARDIPVFREVAGPCAFYFKGLEPQALTNAVRQWLELYKQGKAPRSDSMPRLTWKQSAEQLVRFVLDGKEAGGPGTGIEAEVKR